MSKWVLESIAPSNSALNGQTFGNNFRAIFRLRYKPSRFGSYVETPKLEWNETIRMKEHHKGEWWEFATNMYTHSL